MKFSKIMSKVRASMDVINKILQRNATTKTTQLIPSMLGSLDE